MSGLIMSLAINKSLCIRMISMQNTWSKNRLLAFSRSIGSLELETNIDALDVISSIVRNRAFFVSLLSVSMQITLFFIRRVALRASSIVIVFLASLRCLIMVDAFTNLS